MELPANNGGEFTRRGFDIESPKKGLLCTRRIRVLLRKLSKSLAATNRFYLSKTFVVAINANLDWNMQPILQNAH